MRTNIDIDDDLMVSAMAATGTTTKKAAVEASMRLAVRAKQQEALKGLFGSVVWRGHDDDWFASDEEILRSRGLTGRKPSSEEAPETTSAGTADDGTR
jgi:Arc/MetJ family transcription regulator